MHNSHGILLQIVGQSLIVYDSFVPTDGLDGDGAILLRFFSTTHELEIATCLEDLTFALQWCTTPILIEAHCMELVNMVISVLEYDS